MQLLNKTTGIVEFYGRIEDFRGVEAYKNPDSNHEFEVVLTDADKKRGVQNAIAAKFGGGDHARSSMSLVGKTANALSAALNIHMQFYQRLAAAQSLADVRAAVEPALPLMQRVGAMLAAGELRSVQHAQGVSDEDAVIEGLLAMTQAAAVIEAQAQEKNDAN
jgi:hypothetical protein